MNQIELTTKFGVVINAPGAQLWSLCSGKLNAEAKFVGWGATELALVQTESPLSRYMLKLADGLWYYAHTDGLTCYVSTHIAFKAKSGKQASLMHEANIAFESLETRRREVAVTEARIADLLVAISKEGGQ